MNYLKQLSGNPLFFTCLSILMVSSLCQIEVKSVRYSKNVYQLKFFLPLEQGLSLLLRADQAIPYQLYYHVPEQKMLQNVCFDIASCMISSRFSGEFYRLRIYSQNPFQLGLIDMVFGKPIAIVDTTLFLFSLNSLLPSNFVSLGFKNNNFSASLFVQNPQLERINTFPIPQKLKYIEIHFQQYLHYDLSYRNQSITDFDVQIFINPSTFCGNKKKQGTEECDNGGLKGCTECTQEQGYSCSGEIGQQSHCVLLCGNNIREVGQACDNGNQTGCINCTVNEGYSCNGEVGALSDCKQFNVKCGNKIVETDQQCDNGNKTGCVNCIVSKGFQCFGGLNSISLCLPVCGDGILTANEQCDNKNNSGCYNCKIVPGYSCSNKLGQVSNCSIICGDGIRASTEQCDNGNQIGCSSGCTYNKGFVCTGQVGQKSTCKPVCGDGIRVEGESCDNQQKIGCLTCDQFDLGFSCIGNLNQISTCSAICGDGLKYGAEICDNGNQPGCSSKCKIDQGYSCSGKVGEASICTTICGDFIKAGQEQCDNGNKTGCQGCRIDAGYTCKLLSNGKTSFCSKI